MFTLTCFSVKSLSALAIGLGAGLLLNSCGSNTSATTSNLAAPVITLRNVSYDPTREFYQEYNPATNKHWRGVRRRRG